MPDRCYIAIDLKSFYASVECVERGLDPLTTHLVVADAARSDKTICLAVSPALKAYGIPGRARLFEVVQAVRQVNALRRSYAPQGRLSGVSSDARALARDGALALDYITAPPRMALYMEYSTRIYNIYLRYVAPEDIHVYSIDEVFMDVTAYLRLYKLSPHELVRRMIRDILAQTGITATAGIGTNLYLCKVAMDLVAKHSPADADGVRIAQLDEESYRRQLWDHRPLTDFWRVGRGYARKLEAHGLYTMGDIARCSLGGADAFHNEELLYRLFGTNAQLLIDHAWGWEPCTMADIKAYRPRTNSLSSGQVLPCPYPSYKAEIIVREMTELLAQDLLEKGLVSDQFTLTIGYDIENLTDPARRAAYKGSVVTDPYGRQVPKHGHGTAHTDAPTASARQIIQAVLALYRRIVDPALLVRRVTLTADRLQPRPVTPVPEQISLFEEPQDRAALAREERRQHAVLDIKHRYGKNAILTGTDLQDGATTMERNRQIGGHKA